MTIHRLSRSVARVAGRVPLQTVLIVPFVLQIVVTVGLVGYLSFKSGQVAVEDLAQQLMTQVGERVSERLTDYLQVPQHAVAANCLAVEQGLLNPNDFEQLQQHLWQQITLNSSLGRTYFVNERGEQIGYGYLQSEALVKQSEKLTGEDLSIGTRIFFTANSTDPGQRKYYLVDSTGNPTKLIYTLPIDNRTTPWYRHAKTSGQQTWSPIVVFKVVPSLGMFALAPIEDITGKWPGVFVSDFSLSEISTFLEKLDFSPSGQTFIMDRSGNLVATSTLEMPFAKPAEGEPKRRLAANSQDSRTREIARQLTAKFGNLRTLQATQQLSLESNNERQFVRVTPYQDEFGLDWLVVEVVPESDFMAQIHANTRTTILLCIAALVGSIGVGILIARWITQPILRLNTAAKEIAQGEWDKTVDVNGSAEVGELGQSFNQMAAQLQQYFTELQSSNQALAESDRKLNQILEAMPVGVSVHDTTGKITYANQTSRQLIGIETLPEAGTAQLAQVYRVYLAGSEQLYPVENMPVVRSLQGERARVDDMEIRRPDRTIPLEVCSTPLFDKTGEIIGAIVAFQDITQRKEIERLQHNYQRDLENQIAERTQALQASEERFQEIASTINQLFFIRCGRSRQFLYLSPAYEKIWGRTCESLYQNPDSWLEAIHPDDRQEVIASVAQQFQDNSVTREYRIIRPDGSIRWIYAQVLRVRDETGNLVRFVGFADDITERKRAEEALRTSQQLYRTMARNFPNGAIFLFDHNLRYLVADGQGLGRSGSGHSRKSLEGKTIWEALSPEDCATVEPMYRKALAGVEQIWEVTYRSHTYFCQTVPVKNEAGEIIAGMLVTQDITDRKQAELELQQAKEAAEAASLAKSAFLANMSHELRSPLNAILGFAQLMSSSPTLPAEHQQHVSIITRSGEHLLTLINDVLDLAKVEANRTTLNEQDFDLYRLLDDVEQMFRLKAQSKGLQLIIDRDDAVPQYVRTDAVKLRQVLINLLSNAIKFTAEGGVSLLIQTSNPQAPSPHVQIHFEISDTGAGIAPDELYRIFEPFAQSSTGKQSVEGTGLGLPISRAFIQLMGGEMTVRSVVDKGSTLSFDIQASVVEAAAMTTPQSTRRVTALEPNQPRYRILIVDDKADNRQLLVQLLSPFGFELKEARNGAEAVEIWRCFEPQLIFMDVRMPVMDGYEAAQQIKATANSQAPVIIAVSASLSTLETVTTEAEIFDDFIRKPFRNADIFAAMSQQLGVRFADEDASVAANSPQTEAVTLQRTDLADLPPDLVANLHQATVEGDFELMLILVTEIRSYHEPVADALESLAHRLQYQQILDLTEPSVTEETENY